MSFEVTNLRQFEFDIQAFVNETKLDIGTVLRKFALDVFTEIVKRTPVDTGRARGNWNIAVNASIAPPANWEPPSEEGVRAAAESVANSRTGVLNQVTHETSIAITNHVPYIVALEGGHSGQAPSGWVASAVAAKVAELEDAFNALK